jgi:cytochrome c
MKTQKIVPTIFVMPLLAALYGCQPEGNAPPSGTALPVTPAVQQHATESAAVPAAPIAAASKEDAIKFAKDTGCFACHSLDKKFLGPAWKHVAGVYRDDPAGEAKLMEKIAKGGSGVWGNIDMPAYPGLSEAERRMLVRFILSLE